jgi:hypothetical protein
MKNVVKGQEFNFCNSASAKNVGELVNHIKELSPNEFSNHVNEGKNDFYNWMHDCVDADVAEEIKGVLTQRSMVEKLSGHHWHQHHKKKFGY